MMLKPFKVKSDDGKTFYRDDAAPTQGADARPVAIYQVEQAPGRWTNVSRETFDAWAFGKQIVYATRDAAASDTPETPWSKVMELAEHHGVWIDQYGWVFGNDDAVHAFAQAIAAIAPRGRT